MRSMSAMANFPFEKTQRGKYVAISQAGNNADRRHRFCPHTTGKDHIRPGNFIFKIGFAATLRVTSHQLTHRGYDRHQCQIGFPILCGRKRYKINVWRNHHTVSKGESLSDTKKTFTPLEKITASQTIV